MRAPLDLISAGALYVDQEVVRDGNIVTSRRPSDLGAFCRTKSLLFEKKPRFDLNSVGEKGRQGPKSRDSSYHY